MILTGLLAFLCWCLILPVIYLLGALIERWIDEESVSLRGIYVATFGLAFLGFFLCVLGSVALLKPVPLLMGLGALCFLGRRSIKGFIPWLKELGRFLMLPVPGVPGRISQVLFWIALSVTAVLFSLPEIAHDSLCYHLNLPKLFVRNASVLPLAFDLKSYHSQLMEVLYTVGIFFNNVAVSKMFHGFAGFLTVNLLVIMIDQETRNRGLALFLGLMLWLTPTFLNQVTVTYTDVGLTLFVWAGFALFLKGLNRARSSRDFLWAGLMLGFAVSCKYSAVMFAVPMGAWLVIGLLRAPKGARALLFRSLGLFIGGVFAGCVYWFLRSYFATGDPFFPYLTSKFGSSGLYAEINYAKMGVPQSVPSFLLLPFSIVFAPDIFERHSWAGPFYLLLIPFMAWGAIRDTKARFAAFVSFASVLLWFFLAQNIRFLLPIFPLFLFAAAVGIAKLPGAWLLRPGLKKLGLGMGFFCMLFLAGVGLYHYRIHLLALGQGWSPGKFLTRLERSYPVAQWVNRNLPAGARIFSAEIRQFYFDREMIADNKTFYYPDEDLSQLTPEEFRVRLKRLGVTHVMQMVRAEKDPGPARPNLEVLLRDTKAASFLAEVPSENIRETRYRYEIYKLL